MTVTELLVSSSVLILLVILLRFLFRNKISRRMQYALWLLVVIRLCVPMQFGQLSFSTSAAAERMGEITALQEPSQRQYEKYEAVYARPKTVKEAHEINGFTYTTITLDRMLLPGEVDQEEEKSVDLKWLAPALWLSGTVVLGFWFLLSNVRFQRRAKKNLQAMSVPECPIPVYISEGVCSPCLVGLFRQKILLPPAAAEEPEGLSHIIAHELTHRCHGDVFWGYTRCVLLCVYWFHPLVWWAAFLSKKDCELACDEGAISKLGEEERIPYGQTLLKMVSLSSVRNVGQVATTMAESKKQLAQRIQCIAQQRKIRAVAVLAVLCLAVTIIPVVFAGNKEYVPEAIPLVEGDPWNLPEPQEQGGSIYEAYGKAISQTENVLDYSILDLDGDGIYELALRCFNRHGFAYVFYTYKDGKAIPLLCNLDETLMKSGIYTGGGSVKDVEYEGHDIEQSEKMIPVYVFYYNLGLLQGEDGAFYVEVNTFQMVRLELQQGKIVTELANLKVLCRSISRAAVCDLTLLNKTLLGKESKKTFDLPEVKLEIPENWVEVQRSENGEFKSLPAPTSGTEVISDGKTLDFVHNWEEKTPNVLFLESGRLEGWDDGEWGGGVRYHADSGEITNLVSENFVSYYVTDGRIFVFAGTIHGIGEGVVYEIYEENGEIKSKLRYRFDSAPHAVAAANDYCFMLLNDGTICVFHDGILERITAPEMGHYVSANSQYGNNLVYANGCLYIGKRGYVIEFDINEEIFTCYVCPKK